MIPKNLNNQILLKRRSVAKQGEENCFFVFCRSFANIKPGLLVAVLLAAQHRTNSSVFLMFIEFS